MTGCTIHLVGDIFQEFSSNDGVMTIGRAEALVEEQAFDPKSKTVLLVGQGIPDQRLAALTETIQQKKLGNAVSVERLEDQPRADSRSTHKVKPQNILISRPWRVRDDAYGAHLLIDDRCQDLSDHVSGHHVSGMVLMEAARQLVLAVGEDFLFPKDHPHGFSVVINKLEVSYFSFAFPLGLTLSYDIVEKQVDPRGTIAVEANIGFWQEGRLATEMIWKTTAYDKSFLSGREAAKARDVAASAAKAHQARALGKTA